MAGACDALARVESQEGRRSLLWNVGLVARPKRQGGGAAGAEPHLEQAALDIEAPSAPTVAQLSMWDEVLLDYATQGLSVRAHPVELLRPMLGPNVVTAGAALEDIPHGRTIDVVGAITARQKPATAKGVVFLLLEDESGALNVIVPPDLYKAERTTIRGEPILRIRGRIERHDKVVNLVAREVHRLPKDLRGRSPRRMRSKSWS
jgi:error-prone DNA polymerase